MNERHATTNLTGLLETRLAEGSDARRALGYLGIRRSPKRRFRLDTLLRDHRDGEVDWEPTGRMREAVDGLLEVAELVEIGALAGVFPARLDHPLVKDIVRALELPEMRRYYTEFYPTALPPLFLRRARGERRTVAADGNQLQSAFTTMLGLDSEFFGDEDIATYFLGVLDGYVFVDQDDELDAPAFWREMKSVLNRPSRVKALITQRGDEMEGSVDAACRGFLRFTELVTPMNDLLDSVKDWPRVRTAMWLHYAYWFTSMRADFELLFTTLQEDIAARAMKNAPKEAKKIDGEMRARGAALRRLCDASSFALAPWGSSDGMQVLVPMGKGRFEPL